ncbi:hypothetical protein ACQ1QZ_10960, partial [Ornithobacterium rhinotracheale]
IRGSGRGYAYQYGSFANWRQQVFAGKKHFRDHWSQWSYLIGKRHGRAQKMDTQRFAENAEPITLTESVER